MTKEEFISKLSKEPCQDALDDFDTFSKDYDVSVPFEKILTDFFLEHPNGVEYYWQCWFWNYGLPEEFKTDELINGCALGKPWAALKYAAHHLDEDVLNWCALAAPAIAIAYCSDVISEPLLKKCALMVPEYTLQSESNKFDEEFLEFNVTVLMSTTLDKIKNYNYKSIKKYYD